ncbi:MAG: hypothetical protein IPH35_26575 [Rhodoferax sp.]|nr:hypothetical protein [Rhodoferax sp.]
MATLTTVSPHTPALILMGDWCAVTQPDLHIPANVTADSGIVTGDSGERDRWSVSARFFLCRLVFRRDSPGIGLFFNFPF